MRMNELISGVRADIAIKVMGDDLATLTGSRARRAIVRPGRGAADVRVEQRTNFRCWSSHPIVKPVAVRAQRGDVQAPVRNGVGGTVAGQSSSKATAATTSSCGSDEALRQSPPANDLPIRLGRMPTKTSRREANWPRANRTPCRCARSRRSRERGPNQIDRENGKCRVVVTANVRGRDLGGFMSELRERLDARSCRCPRATGSTMAGPFDSSSPRRNG